MGNKNKGNKGKTRTTIAVEKVIPSSPGQKKKRDYFDTWGDLGRLPRSFWDELERRQNNPLK